MIFFSFSLTLDHMGEKIQTTSLLKVHITFTAKKSCIFLGRVSTKVAQIIVKFQILDFCQLFFVFVNMGPYGGNSFKRHLL